MGKVEEANQKQMPILILFIMFNGVIVTKESCPIFMTWALMISPLFWTLEQIAIDLWYDGVGWDSYDPTANGGMHTTMSNATANGTRLAVSESTMILKFYGLEPGNGYVCLAICVSFMLVCRL